MDTTNAPLQIPGYSIIEGPLGGGMALVFVAQQENTRRKVAIKLIQPRLNASDNMAQYAARFRREAVFQANLHSPHIATLYELGVLNDQPFIVMEYLPGGDLDRKIREAAAHPYTLAEVLCMVRQVATALQVAHEKGVIHRDVKPANILFRANGDAVLTDFGIAKATSDARVNDNITHTVSQFALGTPRYMSPEQLRATQNTSVGVASDLYSLGATLFHVLTGRPPYQADTYIGLAELHFTAPVPRLPKALSPLDELIQKTLAKRPEDRYASAQALIDRINTLEKFWLKKRPAFLQQRLPDAAAVDREEITRVDTARVVQAVVTGSGRRPWILGGIVIVGLLLTAIRQAYYPTPSHPQPIIRVAAPAATKPGSPGVGDTARIVLPDLPPPVSTLQMEPLPSANEAAKKDAAPASVPPGAQRRNPANVQPAAASRQRANSQTEAQVEADKNIQTSNNGQPDERIQADKSIQVDKNMRSTTATQPASKNAATVQPPVIAPATLPGSAVSAVAVPEPIKPASATASAPTPAAAPATTKVPMNTPPAPAPQALKPRPSPEAKPVTKPLPAPIVF